MAHLQGLKVKRGRKPVLKGEYDSLAERLRKVGLKPPPFKGYRQTPPAIRKVLKRILEKALEEAVLASSEKPKNNGVKLPGRFRIAGNWVSCVVLPDGKTVLVSGDDLELHEGEGW